MNRDEVDSRLKAALVKMHVYERDHNRVAFIHTKEILQLIYEHAPIDEKDLKSMLRISASVDKRYITQYLDGFRVWGVIFRENGIIYADKPDTTIQERKEEIRQEEIIEASTPKQKCKYDLPKHGTCEYRGIIKSKKTCEDCKKAVLV